MDDESFVDQRAFVNGEPLKCVVCGNPGFQREEAQLHSQLLTVFNLEWFGPTATCLTCLRCGYIHWFRNR